MGGCITPANRRQATSITTINNSSNANNNQVIQLFIGDTDTKVQPFVSSFGQSPVSARQIKNYGFTDLESSINLKKQHTSKKKTTKVFQQSEESFLRASNAGGQVDVSPFFDAGDIKSQLDNLAMSRKNSKQINDILSSHNLQMQRTVTVKVETTITSIPKQNFDSNHQNNGVPNALEDPSPRGTSINAKKQGGILKNPIIDISMLNVANNVSPKELTSNLPLQLKRPAVYQQAQPLQEDEQHNDENKDVKLQQILSGSEQQGWSRNTNNYEPTMKESGFVRNQRLGVGIVTNNSASPFNQDKTSASLYEDENKFNRPIGENNHSFNIKSVMPSSLINNKFIQPKEIQFKTISYQTKPLRNKNNNGQSNIMINQSDNYNNLLMSNFQNLNTNLPSGKKEIFIFTDNNIQLPVQQDLNMVELQAYLNS